MDGRFLTSHTNVQLTGVISVTLTHAKMPFNVLTTSHTVLAVFQISSAHQFLFQF